MTVAELHRQLLRAMEQGHGALPVVARAAGDPLAGIRDLDFYLAGGHVSYEPVDAAANAEAVEFTLVVDE